MKLYILYSITAAYTLESSSLPLMLGNCNRKRLQKPKAGNTIQLWTGIPKRKKQTKEQEVCSLWCSFLLFFFFLSSCQISEMGFLGLSPTPWQVNLIDNEQRGQGSRQQLGSSAFPKRLPGPWNSVWGSVDHQQPAVSTPSWSLTHLPPSRYK